MKTLRTIAICAASIMLIATGAAAQFVNGDFEDGSTGWSWNLPDGWQIEFPADGGNPGGHAWIMSPFGDSEGQGALSQEFSCGEESGQECVVTFDYKLENVDASSETGRILVMIDGELIFASPLADFIDWTTESLTISCGIHIITVQLVVDAGNNGWRASFDNFSATCEPVSVETRTWEDIKALYR
jgi:hypothetical protein